MQIIENQLFLAILLRHRSKWSGGFFIYNATKMGGSTIWWLMYSYD